MGAVERKAINGILTVLDERYQSCQQMLTEMAGGNRDWDMNAELAVADLEAVLTTMQHSFLPARAEDEE